MMSLLSMSTKRVSLAQINEKHLVVSVRSIPEFLCIRILTFLSQTRLFFLLAHKGRELHLYQASAETLHCMMGSAMLSIFVPNPTHAPNTMNYYVSRVECVLQAEEHATTEIDVC